MATAYAAFTCLMHLLGGLHDHPHPPIQLDEEQVHSLNSMISFFQKFLEDHHRTVDLELEIRIAGAAHSAEDLIETQIADRVLDQNDFYDRLERVMEGMDLIKKEVMEIIWTKESQGNNQPQMPLASPSAENIVVGIEDIAIKIMDKLTSQKKYGRQIISITGMGGIGKTTLARKVYDHPYVKSYFDFCVWTTISKDFNTHASLVELLHCLDGTTSKESLSEKSEHELGEILHKSLFGRRYLVILDDVWDVEAWDRLRSFVPESRGSGIVITTRESSIASIGSHSFGMNLLDERKSWDLFCKKVFGKDNCPRPLENVGKNLANKCRGLPLSIVVIGGHLAKSPRTQCYWEYIAQNLSAVVNSENNDHCLKILSLSYNHLPVYLKPCFLYMGIFSEDEEICISRLIGLWVAEGFLKPINGKSLEEAAKDYLNDFIGRNLILPCRLSRRGTTRAFKIHDLLRDLCLKEASKNNFLCIVRKERFGVRQVSNNERRIVIPPSATKDFYGDVVLQSPALVRTLLFDGKLPSIVYKSLRVLSPVSGDLEISEKTWDKAIHQLVNLRCLRFSTPNWNWKKCFKVAPSSGITNWNLQSVVLEKTLTVTEEPPEIWKMPQLRHIRVWYAFSLPDPPSENNYILKNLQSAKIILNFSFSEDLVKRIPNIKKLEVEYNDAVEGFNGGAYSLDNIARLEKLESFACSFPWNKMTKYMPSNFSFPHSLKKLHFTNLHWDDVITTKIGSLPLLEVLTLFYCSGPEWKLVEGQFVRLTCLEFVECVGLECFTADVSHFPCLKNLILRSMPCLKEISSDIGDISTLRSIELIYCHDSAVVSAEKIAEEQYEAGNEELQIEVRLRYESSLSAKSLSMSNLRVEAFK